MLSLGEDAERLYLWKPAGIPVFPPHADPEGDCLLARMLAEWPSRAGGWPAGFEGGIAHRLDTATSGLVVAARTHEGLAPFRAAFGTGALRKFYLFRSDAAESPAGPPFHEQVRSEPIAHHPSRKDRMVTRRGPRTTHRGKWYDAWTRFTDRGGGWWEAEIRTGVMHQIRVHAAAAGIPLTGDALYGGAPGHFVLHHTCMIGSGWASPVAPLPDDLPADLPAPPQGGPDVLVRP
ncbi:MAG: RNA pseudouridine synthase [Pseudomonadota bacterium]|nr:RNA pseudouridine synthase [Pseudomonadota bacterium]